MPQIPDSVRVTGLLAPSDDTDTYPSHDSKWGRGGYREVADIAERDAIPSDRQRVGMLVYVADSDGLGNPETYILDVIGDPGTYSIAFPGATAEWADGGLFIYPIDGIAKQVSVGKVTAPSAVGAIMEVTNGHFQIGSTWDGPHLIMGAFHFWIDASGNLRSKNGVPTSDLDGIVVGMQNP